MVKPKKRAADKSSNRGGAKRAKCGTQDDRDNSQGRSAVSKKKERVPTTTKRAKCVTQDDRDNSQGHDRDNSQGHSAVSKKQERVPTTTKASTELDAPVDEVICRCSPNMLINAFSSMNATQRKAVHELGFDKLIHIQVSEVPGKLAFWCLQHFQPISSSLEIPGKEPLHIGEEDVWLTLGIPNGSIKPLRKGKRAESHLLDQWASAIGKNRYRILPDDVLKAMLKDVEGGVWFKRHFMILMESCLFECSTDGYIRPKIIDNLNDVSTISQYNWCGHMVSELIRHHNNWKQNNPGYFTGPCFFLVMFYVDRIVHYMRTVPREFPTVRGWTKMELRKRVISEKKRGGFGQGYIDQRHDPGMRSDGHDNTPLESVQINDDKDVGDVAQVGLGDVRARGEPHSTSSSADNDNVVVCGDQGAGNINATDAESHDIQFSEVDRQINQLLCTAGHMAESMSKLIRIIQDAPPDIKEQQRFRIAAGTCRHLMGVQTSPAQLTLQANEAKMEWTRWERKEWSTTLDKMLEVIDSKDRYNKDAGYPDSFLLSNMSPSSVHVSTQMSDPEAQVVDRAIKDADAVTNKEAEEPTKHFEDSTVVVNTPTTEEVRVYDGCKDGPDIEPASMEDDSGTANAGNSFASQTPVSMTVQPDATTAMRPNTRAKIESHKVKHPPHAMVKRSQSKKKPASTLLSPFNDRAIKLADRLNVDEKIMYYWMLTNDAGIGSDVVYDDGCVEVTRLVMRSMEPEQYIGVGVIDAWTSHLNRNERYRSKDSPSRFFFSATICTATIVDRPESWGDAEAKNAFYERLMLEMDRNNHIKISAIDLIFFPICSSNHYYVVCFDMKKNCTVIIDNSKSTNGDDITAKYGTTPSTLREMFCAFMTKHNLPVKARRRMSTEIERLKMQWRNTTNKVDCGVYAMRHMETYMGHRIKDWDTGFRAKSQTKMRIYRAKYCKALLCSKFNLKKEENEAAAKRHLESASPEVQKDIDNFIASYVRGTPEISHTE